MRYYRFSLFLFSVFSVIAASSFLALAQTSSAEQLKLLPAPKQVEIREGRFVVNAETKILIEARHEREDGIAAEMLAEEIHNQIDLKVPVEAAHTALRAGGAIVLGRLDDEGLRATLESKGLKAERNFDDQGYLIYADKSRIIVAGQTGQGLFYGVQTLRQLLRPEGKKLVCPEISIKDWPSMKWRGLHDDLSRGPIPTIEYMKKEIRTLAEYKVNLFGMYMEHVFDFQSQPLIAPKDAAFTPEEIKELVAYAQKYYVTLLPEQQTFGHLHHALKYEIYSDLAETPHGHVLTPTNPKSYEFIQSLYSELVPLFPGPFLHVGADETLELGRGQTKARADQIGLGRVYMEHLQKVFDVLKPYHKELMFWGDIAVKYPELLSILPKDMIAVPWDYDAKPSFDAIIKPYRDAGLRVIVAPGANNWNAIWPRFDVAYVNIRNFVRDGQNLGAMGMLNTTWDDDGEALFDMTWPALVFGASAGWQPGESNIDAFKNSYDWAFYRNDDTTFRDILENLDHCHAVIAEAGYEGAMDNLYWSDPFTEGGAVSITKQLPVMHEFRLSAEHATESLYRNRTKARAHASTLDDMLLAGWRLDTLGMKVQFTSEIEHFYQDAYQNQADPQRVEDAFEDINSMNGRLQDLRDSTTRLRKMYAEAWLRENRPYWLDNVLVRYDNLANEIQGKIVAAHQAQLQYNNQKTLPTPESLGFYLK
jgi:hexosaminidase